MQCGDWPSLDCSLNLQGPNRLSSCDDRVELLWITPRTSDPTNSQVFISTTCQPFSTPQASCGFTLALLDVAHRHSYLSDFTHLTE
jgi:hypothetical protein